MKGKAAGKKTRPNAVSAAGMFGVALLDIGWRLAILVMAGLLGGKKADEYFDTAPVFALIGFLGIIIGFVAIVISTLRKIPKEYGGLKK